MSVHALIFGCHTYVFDELALINPFFFKNYRMYSIYKRYENPYLSTFLGEIIGLSVLWLFWIVGAAIATVGDSLVGSL